MTQYHHFLMTKPKRRNTKHIAFVYICGAYTVFDVSFFNGKIHTKMNHQHRWQVQIGQ